MSSLCTNDICSSDNAIAKCTESTAMECYKWLIAYDTTTMTHNGCTSKGFTSTIPHSYGPTFTPSTIIVTETVTKSMFSASTLTSPNSSGEKRQSLGPIVGGTVGGCTILSIVALTAFLVHRRRVKAKSSQPPSTSEYHRNSPEFDPNGFPTTGWSEQDIKNWQQSGGVHRPGVLHMGVSEVHGEDRAVEVEAPEKTKAGHWHAPGHGPVEVEAPMRDEKKRWWRAPVEAPR